MQHGMKGLCIMRVTGKDYKHSYASFFSLQFTKSRPEKDLCMVVSGGASWWIVTNMFGPLVNFEYYTGFVTEDRDCCACSSLTKAFSHISSNRDLGYIKRFELKEKVTKSS